MLPLHFDRRGIIKIIKIQHRPSSTWTPSQQLTWHESRSWSNRYMYTIFVWLSTISRGFRKCSCLFSTWCEHDLRKIMWMRSVGNSFINVRGIPGYSSNSHTININKSDTSFCSWWNAAFIILIIYAYFLTLTIIFTLSEVSTSMLN